ncbi:MAG: hypothetical protein ABJC74_11565 [Gemmatimonadota bacterium]
MASPQKTSGLRGLKPKTLKAEAAVKIKGGTTRKLPGKRKPPTLTLK